MSRYDRLVLGAGSLLHAAAAGAFAQPSVINGEAIRPFFSLANLARVDVVGIGDSNEIHTADGWDEGWHMALGQRFGEYATGLLSVGEYVGNGVGQGYKYNTLSSASSGQYTYTDAPADVAKFLNNPPSLLGPNDYMYLASGRTAIGSTIQGFSIDGDCPIGISGPLRFHFSYGLFSGAGAGSFQLMVRYEVPPYTVLTTGPVISTRTGDASASRVGFATIDLPAAQRSLGIAMRYCPISSNVTGPFIGYYVRCENVSATHGAAFSSLYAVGSQSARDMALALSLSSDETLSLYFTSIRETQGAQKAVLVRICDALNDRAENLPSVGSGITPSNSAAAYEDNVRYMLSRIRGIWTLNNWPQEELYFLLTPSHPVANPDEAALISYRDRAEQIALTSPRTACVRLDRLTNSNEMLANHWYQQNGFDRDHLTDIGYRALASRELLYLLAATCIADFNNDGGIDGQDVQAFFQAWEAGDFLADVNQDGGVDGADVGTFVTQWATGGC